MFQSPHATNFGRVSTVQWRRSPVSRYYSGRVRGLWESFCFGKDFKVLILYVIDVMDNTIIDLKSSVSFIISHHILACWISSLDCWLQLRISWWWTVHHTCYPYCCFLLVSWRLSYEEKYFRYITMVMIWFYIVQMSVNDRITWCNQCVQNVIRVEAVWDIGG